MALELAKYLKKMQISGLFFLEIAEDFRSFLSINERVILGDVPETQIFLQLVFFNKKNPFTS